MLGYMTLAWFALLRLWAATLAGWLVLLVLPQPMVQALI